MYTIVPYTRRYYSNLNLHGKVQLVKQISYDAIKKNKVTKGERTSETRMFFNSSGFKTSENWFGANDNVTYKFSYEFNAENQNTKYSHESTSSKGYTLYSYDSDGNISERVAYDASDVVEEKEVMTYDKNKNVILLKKYDADSKLIREITYKYKYDDRQNMLENQTFYDGSLHQITRNEYNENNL